MASVFIEMAGCVLRLTVVILSIRLNADRGHFEHSFKMLTVVILSIRLKC
jgi:hypothetical protein